MASKERSNNYGEEKKKRLRNEERRQRRIVKNRGKGGENQPLECWVRDREFM